ncbi:MAG TPA: hypothetical protein VKE94_23705 [Gemmataceae bacterium]|nr:hypothetical protein [Gemmataceae bacterium]
MPVQLKCPSCSSVLRLPDGVPPGGSVRCPKCKEVLRMPGKAPAPAAPPMPTTPAPKAAAKQPPASPPRAIKPASAKAPRARLHADEFHEDADDDTPRRVKKSKSNKGLLIGCLAGVAALFLVCGGASFGVYWAIKKGAEKVQKSLEELTEQLKQAEKNRLDVSFIHADCNAAFVIQPARMIQSEESLIAPEDWKKIVTSGIEETGIDFSKVERVIVVMEPTSPGQPRNRPQPDKRPGQQPPQADNEPAPVTAAVIFHFTDLVDGMQILNKDLKETEPVPAGDKTYFRSKSEKADGAPLAGYFDGHRTVLIGPEPMIKKMVGAKNVFSPLIVKLREFELDNDIFGIFLMGPFKPALRKMAQSPDIPPQLEQAKKLDQTLSAVKVLGNLDNDELLEVILVGENDAAGGSLEDLARNALDMGKAFYPLFKTQMQKAMQKDVPPQVSEKIFKVTDQILKKDGITVTREGKEVTVTLNKPKHL